MTEVLFITSTDRQQLRDEVNGTMLLATGLLQNGIDTDILRFYQIPGYKDHYWSFIDNAVSKIMEYDPKCVSFYCLWQNYTSMLRIARVIKQSHPDIITVLGGPQASATAEATMEAAEYIDYICTGEGETTVVPFFRAVLNHKDDELPGIPGLFYRADGRICRNTQQHELCDLNTLPYWDDRLISQYIAQPEPDYTRDNYFMPIDAGRGCPYSCTFCCSSYFWRRTYRLKSPDRLIEEIRYYIDKFGIRSFLFSHDAFTVNQALIAAFCDRIIEEKLDIRWRCTSRIDCLSKDLILKMKRAGMVSITFGIETGSSAMQKRINKNLNLSSAKELIGFLLENKLHVTPYFMYGFPDETEQELQDTLQLAFDLIDLGVSHASMSFCVFNPQTAITEQYFDELVLDPSLSVIAQYAFGYEEEYETIAANKALFPFYYHLSTPLRNEYQNLNFLLNLYLKFRTGGKLARSLYHGDNLRFYRDFCRNNQEALNSGPTNVVKALKSNMVSVLQNTVRDLELSSTPQIMELLQYLYDVSQFSRADGSFPIRKVYGFHYLEYKMGVSPEKLSKASSELLFQNKDGKLSISVLGITEGT